MKDFLKLNLQFFSEPEGNQEPNNDNPEGQSNDNDTKPNETEKTFSQQDVNNIAAKEAKSAQEKLLKELGIEDFNSAKEGLQKFQEWQDAQKTDAEKKDEQLNQLTDTNTSLQAENNTLKAQISAMKQGVNSESIEDVVALAERQVSDDVTLDDAIKSVIEKYPHFKAVQEVNPIKPTFLNSDTGNNDGELDAFEALKQKYNK
ncbi:hypothetical protein L2Z53_03790 [Macrococcoides canis]|uniref:hypothetical protein n=1 Tax=Macrococcoides canis TaxID=1855823 RepID=UPI001F2F3BF7|nr:hypothetical protein [Macrococcus canis]UJS28479.1 hypothetical protein L2Z53_03790 [Macrococcus canis]